MNRIIYRIIMCFALMGMVIFPATGTAVAANSPIIEDGANLFTDEEELEILEAMKPITEYGGIAVVTNAEDAYYSGEASDLAESLCEDYFHGESGSVVLIDMYNRRIQIYSTGLMYKYISKTNANVITDKYYTYATAGDYATCVKLMLGDMQLITEGGSVSTPLRYVSNFFVAACLGLFITFIIALVNRGAIGSHKNKDNVELPAGEDMDNGAVAVKKIKMVKQTRTRHTSSSGGGGGHSGGGGGGHSGGGGGHSF